MFKLEKNQNRNKELVEKALMLSNMRFPGKTTEYNFYYSGQLLIANFVVFNHPFYEKYNGKTKMRKGFVICTVRQLLNDINCLARGFSVCSDKDEWSDNKGCLEAFVDAISYLSYADRKAAIDDNWREIFNNADKNLKEV